MSFIMEGSPPFLFFAGMIGTILFLRLYLLISPQTNIYLSRYNVHHLYTGAFLLIVLTILRTAGINASWLTLLSGIASGLIVDQLVYLVTSKGGHEAYYGKISFLGMLGITAFLLLIGMVASLLVR
jgi:hypothetical protein